MDLKYEILKNYQDVLTFKELQEILKIGRTQAYKLLKNGIIKSTKVGKKYRIPKVFVIDYIFQCLGN